MDNIYLICAVCGFFVVLGILIKTYLYKPFKYPNVIIRIDISGKRQPVYEDFVDEWINNLYDHRQGIKNEFYKVLNEWETNCDYYLEHCILWKSHRKNLYNNMKSVVNEENYEMFKFVFYRNQTRYRQTNYQKHAYTVQKAVCVFYYSLKELLEIDDELEEINYETTREKWVAKNQRKLMTKELKERIKRRDNYTCQICGKYMPDEVGLHIDHIIPIKQGGKSIESNLQVLCDKCNLRKGKRSV